MQCESCLRSVLDRPTKIVLRASTRHARERQALLQTCNKLNLWCGSAQPGWVRESLISVTQRIKATLCPSRSLPLSPSLGEGRASAAATVSTRSPPFQGDDEDKMIATIKTCVWFKSAELLAIRRAASPPNTPTPSVETRHIHHHSVRPPLCISMCFAREP